MKQFLVDPPRPYINGREAREFETRWGAEEYAARCPPRTRIVDRAGGVERVLYTAEPARDPFPCHSKPRDQWCDSRGPAGFMGHTCRAAPAQAPPIACGVLDYFPDALAAVAEVSRAGSLQHHPNKTMHWDKSRPASHADSLLRHLVDRGKRDTDGMRHSAKAAWRALALLQQEIEREIEREAAEVQAAEPRRLFDAEIPVEKYPCTCPTLGDGMVYCSMSAVGRTPVSLVPNFCRLAENDAH